MNLAPQVVCTIACVLASAGAWAAPPTEFTSEIALSEAQYLGALFTQSAATSATIVASVHSVSLRWPL